jgi:hypothetical protein
MKYKKARIKAHLDVKIAIDWKKSRMWGYNPHATVWVYYKDTSSRTEGRASGCGYDKKSAAVGRALAGNAAFLEFLKDNRALKKAHAAKLYAVDSFRRGRKKELCFSISGKGLGTLAEFLRFFGCYTVAEFGGETFDGVEYRSKK